MNSVAKSRMNIKRIKSDWYQFATTNDNWLAIFILFIVNSTFKSDFFNLVTFNLAPSFLVVLILSIIILGNFSCFLLSSADLLKNDIFFRNTIIVSNCSDPVQDRHSVGTCHGPNCLQTLSANDKRRASRERVNRAPYNVKVFVAIVFRSRSERWTTSGKNESTPSAYLVIIFMSAYHVCCIHLNALQTSSIVEAKTI